MKGEVKIAMEMAKKTIDKEIYKKLSDIEEPSELTSAVKRAIVTVLEREEYMLGKKIQYMKNYGKDVFFAENKYLLLDSKIKHFKASFDQEDLIKAQKIINDIKKEMVHVQSVKSV